ncbi:conserved hypothetical protein [Coccidioides posadasii str. Silveira]|uniref:Uncharacterized protein n=1 Tax=Coccidioides posadasii (strain RMSCC 757 / Silveira) TaxID=443226 RepID=E9D7V5_COCPS|nr:conserved hypothetical protein [Coccidioides posadasii str. Silveira]
MVRPKRETGWGGICRSDWVIKYRSSLPDKKQPHEGDNSSSPKIIEPTVGYRSTSGFDSSTHHGVVLCASHASKSHVQMHSSGSEALQECDHDEAAEDFVERKPISNDDID